ncbi:MAG: hypothetical protein J6W40_04470 [Alphaproteobacteria bacterium]|nr:hypothetical protein [Alphaproteobacteria bacterium]
MKQAIDIDATIKSAYGAIVKIIEAKIEQEKSKKTVTEYEKIQRDMLFLREVAKDPAGFFEINSDPNDANTLMNYLSDLNSLTDIYSPRMRLLDALVSVSSQSYSEQGSKEQVWEKLLKLNKTIQLKAATGVMRAINLFRTNAAPSRFAVYAKTK